MAGPLGEPAPLRRRCDRGVAGCTGRRQQARRVQPRHRSVRKVIPAWLLFGSKNILDKSSQRPHSSHQRVSSDSLAYVAYARVEGVRLRRCLLIDRIASRVFAADAIAHGLAHKQLQAMQMSVSSVRSPARVRHASVGARLYRQGRRCCKGQRGLPPNSSGCTGGTSGLWLASKQLAIAAF